MPASIFGERSIPVGTRSIFYRPPDEISGDGCWLCLTDQTMERARDLALGLRPSLLDDLGLASFQKLQQLGLVHVRGDQFPLSDHVHADQSLG